MIVKIANYSGFCFGVKRAVELTEKELKKDSLLIEGQLIHNNEETKRLSDIGLKTVDNIENYKNDNVLIRSHGETKSYYDKCKKNNLSIIDATCPYVKKVQKIVSEHYKTKQIVILGNKNHPEIIGINGWCENTAIIISDYYTKLAEDKEYCVVAQTTLLDEHFNAFKELNNTDNITYYNTICSATKERQLATKLLAPTVDCMIVIGGFHSSNTLKLVEISKKLCDNVLHIEKKSDLDCTILQKYSIIGLTAGASTPNWLIKDIASYIEGL